MHCLSQQTGLEESLMRHGAVTPVVYLCPSQTLQRQVVVKNAHGRNIVLAKWSELRGSYAGRANLSPTLIEC